MPLADRLPHTIVIERQAQATDRDGRTPPTATWSTLATVGAWVQPLEEPLEIADASGAGTVVATHRTFLAPTVLVAADVFRFGGPTGPVHEVLSVVDAAGKGHHLEVLSRTLTAGGA